jgi:nucleoside-diphosphate kinase
LERTLVLIKPDAVQRGLTFEILDRLERRGLKLVGLKFLRVPEDLARQHYAVHAERPFFGGLISYITSSPIVAAVFEGTRAVEVVRNTVGKTNPADAQPGTIRGDFSLEIGRNLVHASDSPENGQQEVALWFAAGDLVDWPRQTDRWIFE